MRTPTAISLFKHAMECHVSWYRKAAKRSNAEMNATMTSIFHNFVPCGCSVKTVIPEDQQGEALIEMANKINEKSTEMDRMNMLIEDQRRTIKRQADRISEQEEEIEDYQIDARTKEILFSAEQSANKALHNKLIRIKSHWLYRFMRRSVER